MSARAAALAILVAGAFSATIDWMWEVPVVFAPVVVAAAAAHGARPVGGPRPEAEQVRVRRRALAVGWVTIVAALLAFFGQARSGERGGARARRPPESIDQANTAETLAAVAAEPYLLEAAALEAQGDLEGARAAVGEALYLRPPMRACGRSRHGSR